MQFNIISVDGQSNITVFDSSRTTPFVADSSHPRFDEIVQKVLAGDVTALDLFDLSVVVSNKFEELSERVSVANGRVYFDGVEVNSSLTKQIIRFLNEDIEDWISLVNFFEKVETNPDSHSREMLFDWLNARDFTITDDGDIVGYKGVTKRQDGSLVSGYYGRAMVDGEVFTGQIPNPVNSVVTMPRNEVTHDPSDACSRGLHVGTFEYAKGYANGAMLEVHVNPRDVVSVPTDASGEKVRVCRYYVANVIDAPLTSPLKMMYDEDEYEDSGDLLYSEDCYCGEKSSWECENDGCIEDEEDTTPSDDPSDSDWDGEHGRHKSPYPMAKYKYNKWF